MNVVDISRETPEETEARLRQVLFRARLESFEHPYAFLEYPLERSLVAASANALALVRDDAVWSQLVPCSDPAEELYAIFRFHFPPGADNSGFVGWLASHLKRSLGTGVLVICGQNRGDGGIFDYWGVPYALRKAVSAEIGFLIAGVQAPPSS